MKSRLKAGLVILTEMTALSIVVTGLVYVLNYGISFAELRKMFYETLVYSNIIAFPSNWIFPRLFRAVSKRGPVVQWTVFVVTMIAISSAGSILGSLAVLGLKLEPGVPFGNILWVSFRICVLISLVVGVVQAMLERMNDRLEDAKLKLRTQELERERAIKLATQARLDSLEARLHPHFLFNTLNSISSLIPADPNRAERLVERMAALLRFSLDAHRSGQVPLEQELKVVRDYLEIEQVRLGERLRYRIDAANVSPDFTLPPLSIQTLVENSIKYAVAPNREGGEIVVRTDRDGDAVNIQVTDTGPGFLLDSIPAGHGLDNLRGRLAALYGDAAELSVSRENGTSVVTMKVPT